MCVCVCACVLVYACVCPCVCFAINVDRLPPRGLMRDSGGGFPPPRGFPASLEAPSKSSPYSPVSVIADLARLRPRIRRIVPLLLQRLKPQLHVFSSRSAVVSVRLHHCFALRVVSPVMHSRCRRTTPPPRCYPVPCVILGDPNRWLIPASRRRWWRWWRRAGRGGRRLAFRCLRLGC